MACCSAFREYTIMSCKKFVESLLAAAWNTSTRVMLSLRRSMVILRMPVRVRSARDMTSGLHQKHTSERNRARDFFPGVLYENMQVLLQQKREARPKSAPSLARAASYTAP
jgi:hypothetical protein